MEAMNYQMRLSINAVAITLLGLTLASCGGGGNADARSGVATQWKETKHAQWKGTRQLGAVGAYSYGSSVATDKSGSVYVAGQTQGGIDGNTLTGIYDFFVTKYDRQGSKLFTRQLGVTGAVTSGYSVATDSKGNFYVAGYTTGALDGNSLTGYIDFFVTKYDSSGNKLFTRQLGVAGQATLGLAVATDGGNNVYVAGYTTGGLDGNALTGTYDFFVTKYDRNGIKLFTRQLGAPYTMTLGQSVTIDRNGNVYVAGNTQGELDGNTRTGGQDFFVTKFDGNGNKIFTRQLGAAYPAYTLGQSVATDRSGNVSVAGYTTGGIDGNALTGVDDLFVTKYDSNGNKLFTRQLGVAGQATYGNSVAADDNGNIYVAGATDGALDGITLTGVEDFFVTKYASNGNKVFTRLFGTAGSFTYGSSVALYQNEYIYIAGVTNGALDGNTLTGTNDLFVSLYNSAGVKQ
jgi:hypothetical protein